MKRFSLFVAFGALLIGAGVAQAVQPHICINYSTKAAATYADGTSILSGERFLLVWFDTGVTIDLKTDITGDENSFLGDNWEWVSFAEATVAGTCHDNKWELSAKASSDYYSQGRVQLYLLDTRISSTELAPMVANEEGDDFPSRINAVVPIEGATYSWSALDANPHTITGVTAPATKDWTVYRTIATTPTPVIVSLVRANGVMTVGATNTVATANYLLRGSLDLSFTNTVWAAQQLGGKASPTAVLEFTDSHATNSAAFYRIELVK